MGKKNCPLSLDLVVACQIFEIQKNGEKAEFGDLVNRLGYLMHKSTTPRLLRSLQDWGIVGTEFGVTKKGRVGRFYFITSEAHNMIRETYELFWSKIPKKDEE